LQISIMILKQAHNSPIPPALHHGLRYL
jgi:hypothetical protein